ADPPSPGRHPDQVDGGEAHLVPSGETERTRFTWCRLCCCASRHCSRGLIVGWGAANDSSHSVRSSERTTRTTVVSDDPCPSSRDCSDERETLARSASGFLVRRGFLRNTRICEPTVRSHSSEVRISCFSMFYHP